jgi:hypothetical protein
MKKPTVRELVVIALLAAALVAGAAPKGSAQTSVRQPHAAQAATAVPPMPHFKFENFTTANGLPNNHVYSVLVDGDRVWAGTDDGLGVYENGKWKTYNNKDGLAHRAVLSLSLDKRTGDVWAGTMGGLSRISGGRIVSYTQLNSGLSNGGLPPEYAHRRVVALQRAQYSDEGDLGLWRFGPGGQSLLCRLGQRTAGVHPEDGEMGHVRRS